MADRLLPPGATESWLEHGGGRIRVLRGGPGQQDGGSDALPVLLIHGGGYDNAAISWAKVFGPLSSDRRVIAPDLPGFGYTEGIPVTGQVGDLADLVITVARSYGLRRLVVAGISMGGDVAMHVALRHPEAVAGLVLVAPGGLTERLKNAPTQLAAWLAAQLPDPVLYGLGRFAGRFSDSSCRGWCTTRRPSTRRSGPSSLARPVARLRYGLRPLQPGHAGPARDAQRPAAGRRPDHRTNPVPARRGRSPRRPRPARGPRSR